MTKYTHAPYIGSSITSKCGRSLSFASCVFSNFGLDTRYDCLVDVVANRVKAWFQVHELNVCDMASIAVASTQTLSIVYF